MYGKNVGYGFFKGQTKLVKFKHPHVFNVGQHITDCGAATAYTRGD